MEYNLKPEIFQVLRILGTAATQKQNFSNFGLLVNKVITGCPPIIIPLKKGGHASVSFRNPKLASPTCWTKWGIREKLTPARCRITRDTYASELTVSLQIEFKYIVDGVKQTTHHTVDDVVIGSIPIPIGSEPCITRVHPELLVGHDREPSYTTDVFIAGTPRIVESKEEMIPGRFVCFKNLKIELRSRTDIYGPITYLVVAYQSQDRAIVVRQSNVFRGDIELTTVMAALGYVSDKAILECILSGVTSPRLAEAIKFHLPQTFLARTCLTQAEALAIIKSRSDHDIDVLMSLFMPNCSNVEQKVYTIGRMCRKFILVEEGYIEPDNRDTLTNKGVISPPMAYANLLQSCMRKVVGHLKTPLSSQLQTQDPRMIDRNMFAKAILTMLLLNSMKTPIATGVLTGINVRTGFTEVVNEQNILSIIAGSRRISQGSSSTGLGSSTTQHRTKNDSDFFKCAEGVQDGQKIGEKGTMSMTVCHAQYSDPREVISVLTEYLAKTGIVTVCVNGAYVGMTDIPNNLVCDLRNKKRRCIIHPHTGIIWDIINNIIYIDTDQGRIVRPVFVVEDQNLLLKHGQIFTSEGEIISSGIIEFLSPSEVSHAFISMFPKDLATNPDYEYCELHPGAMNDVSMALIPFPWMNQSPRNVYQNQMGRQALGDIRGITSAATKIYAQMFAEPPLIRNMTEVFMGLDGEIRVGFNARVMVVTIKGRGQEDPKQISKASLDRGMAMSLGLFPEVIDTCSNHPKTGKEEVYGNPNATEDSITGVDGMPKIGKYIRANDVIVSKVSPYNTAAGLMMADSSIKCPSHGLVDTVRRVERVVKYTIGGNQGCTVMTTSPIKTTTGDKFAARHGQKGVVSSIIQERDMPNSPNGHPDIILNPHALPSRMTMGMLVEMLLSRKCIYEHKPEYVEPFENMSVERVCEMLAELGLNSTGDEVVYDGETGKKMTVKIFEGVCYYQKLKHLVNSKVHSRSNGPRVVVTRQPSEGKMKNGGLRIGEMERDALISQSCTASLMTKFMKHSDEFQVYVCDMCGSYAQRCGQGHTCVNCNGTTTVSLVGVPYALKLMTQELEAMGISSRIMTK